MSSDYLFMQRAKQEAMKCKCFTALDMAYYKEPIVSKLTTGNINPEKKTYRSTWHKSVEKRI